MSVLRIYRSNSVGNLSVFADGFKGFPLDTSLTIDDGFDFTDRSSFRVWMQIEPPEVINYVHATEFPQIKQTTKEQLLENKFFYDLILAWDEDILRECPHAVLFPAALCTWIDPCYVPFCKTQETHENQRSDYDDQHPNLYTRIRG